MNDATRRALRTFVQVFLGVFLVSAVGFLGQIQEWASCAGDTACKTFPDLGILAKAAVSAVSAAVVAVLTFGQNLLEDKGVIPSVLKSRASSGANPVTEDPAH